MSREYLRNFLKQWNVIDTIHCHGVTLHHALPWNYNIFFLQVTGLQASCANSREELEHDPRALCFSSGRSAQDLLHFPRWKPLLPWQVQVSKRSLSRVKEYQRFNY